MNEFLIILLAVGGFVSTAFIGYEMFKNNDDDESFTRKTAEDAMRIKAKQFEETYF